MYHKESLTLSSTCYTIGSAQHLIFITWELSFKIKYKNILLVNYFSYQSHKFICAFYSENKIDYLIKSSVFY